jgi:membrane protein
MVFQISKIYPTVIDTFILLRNFILAKAETPLTTASVNHSHSLYTVIKRVMHTLLASLVIALLVALLLMLQRYQQEWLHAQTAYAGNSAARQYAKLLQPLMSKPDANDDKSANASVAPQLGNLNSVIKVLADEPHVLGISVFDEKGRYLAPLPKTESVVSLNQSHDVLPITFVESIVCEQGRVVGYLHIHMDTEKVLEAPLSLRSQLFVIAVIVLFIALVVGIYVTRGFYKFRPWLLDVITQILKRRL